MRRSLDNAVSDLIIRNQGQVNYVDTGDKVEIISKPAHYTIGIQLIDKKARKAKKASIVFQKTYTYPKELENAVCWDMLLNMRQAMVGIPEAHEAWNSTFAARFPELEIPIKNADPLVAKTKHGWGTNANAYIAGYHKAERKYKALGESLEEKAE